MSSGNMNIHVLSFSLACCFGLQHTICLRLAPQQAETSGSRLSVTMHTKILPQI